MKLKGRRAFHFTFLFVNPWMCSCMMDKNRGKIIVVGLGPGSPEDITFAVRKAVEESKVIIGYKYYFQFIEDLLTEETICINTDMKKERERAMMAFEYAETGDTVCVISSGDASIYGMVPLIYEMKRERNSSVEVIVHPGITAFQKAAALLGAPIGHDFCVISLSDLMTPWQTIEKRIKAAAEADFVTAVYNPRSRGRYWQLDRLKEIFLLFRSPETPVGYVRQAGREEQVIHHTTLGEFSTEECDMFTIVIIGNTQSYFYKDHILTPRGYYREGATTEGEKIGQNIMIQSFRTIDGELKKKDIPLDHKWALLHAIHTTADFEMEHILYSDNGAVETLHKACVEGKIRTIITDVTMAMSGIRKGALERLGLEVKCYLQHGKVQELASRFDITRTQAGIRIAVEEHPDALFVFGNAPTALMELATLIRKGKARPSGIVAAPVGFVNVCESKHMIKPFKDIPKLIVEGRKGGSNLAATLVNSILSLEDASELKPGRDL